MQIQNKHLEIFSFRSCPWMIELQIQMDIFSLFLTGFRWFPAWRQIYNSLIQTNLPCYFSCFLSCFEANFYFLTSSGTCSWVFRQALELLPSFLCSFISSYPEMVTGFFFILMTLLWFTREPGFVPGWSSFFEKWVKFPKQLHRHTTLLLMTFYINCFPQRHHQPHLTKWWKMESLFKNQDFFLKLYLFI